MEKNTFCYSWKVNVSFDFNKPDNSFTSLSVKLKNKKKKRPYTIQMARPRKTTKSVSKRQTNTSQNQTKKVSPSNKKTPRGKIHKRNVSSPYNTRIKIKRTAVEESKPVAVYEISDTPILTEKTVRRYPRPVIDNNVYIVPDSDDDDDIVLNDVRSNINMPEEKRKQIQDYINSITPNRVDYGTKAPKADIIQIKGDELINSPEATEDEIQRIIRKHAKSMRLSPETNVIERVDYKEGGISIQSRTPIANTIVERCQVDLEPVPSTSKANNLENGNFTIPTSTRHKHARDMNSPKDTEVMEYVDEIVAEHRDKISMEIEERYDRMWKQEDESKRRRMEAEKNNCIDFDSSIEIIETPEIVDKDIKMDVSQNEKKETKEKPEKLCPICLESLSDGKELSATVCGHVYCTPCIKTAIRTHHRCPACRTKLTLKKIIPLFL